MADIEVLAEDQVSIESLQQLFKRAFFKASIDEDGDLVVQGEGPRVFVMLLADNKLIKFMCMYGLREDAPMADKLALVNRMNDDVILGRFCVPVERPDLLMADYYLGYEEGVSAYQVINAMRMFGRVVQGAIRLCDADSNLVE